MLLPFWVTENSDEVMHGFALACKGLRDANRAYRLDNGQLDDVMRHVLDEHEIFDEWAAQLAGRAVPLHHDHKLLASFVVPSHFSNCPFAKPGSGHVHPIARYKSSHYVFIFILFLKTVDMHAGNDLLRH